MTDVTEIDFQNDFLCLGYLQLYGAGEDLPPIPQYFDRGSFGLLDTVADQFPNQYYFLEIFFKAVNRACITLYTKDTAAEQNQPLKQSIAKGMDGLTQFIRSCVCTGHPEKLTPLRRFLSEQSISFLEARLAVKQAIVSAEKQGFFNDMRLVSGSPASDETYAQAQRELDQILSWAYGTTPVPAEAPNPPSAQGP